jgi:UV DNA damage endonuclease
MEKIVSPRGKIKFVNLLGEKHLQFNAFNKGKYKNEEILKTYYNNVSNLLKILIRIEKEGFHCFRMSSNLLPLIDIVDPSLLEDKTLLNLLNSVGDTVKNLNIRLTCHPDQFVVLSSKEDNIIEKSINQLKYHAWIFDRMDLPKNPYYAINVHGGVKQESKKLIESIDRLPENIRNRLTLENDERSYSLQDLLEVNKQTQVPIVWDSHHHSFNPGTIKNESEALEMAMKSWPENIKPLTHLSNTDPQLKNGSFTERRKHSDYVHYIPECQLTANNNGLIDIDFEFKMKNLAINKAVNEFGISL